MTLTCRVVQIYLRSCMAWLNFCHINVTYNLKLCKKVYITYLFLPRTTIGIDIEKCKIGVGTTTTFSYHNSRNWRSFTIEFKIIPQSCMTSVWNKNWFSAIRLAVCGRTGSFLHPSVLGTGCQWFQEILQQGSVWMTLFNLVCGLPSFVVDQQLFCAACFFFHQHFMFRPHPSTSTVEHCMTINYFFN